MGAEEKVKTLEDASRAEIKHERKVPKEIHKIVCHLTEAKKKN